MANGAFFQTWQLMLSRLIEVSLLATRSLLP
jgi:hypothetical protein